MKLFSFMIVNVVLLFTQVTTAAAQDAPDDYRPMVVEGKTWLGSVWNYFQKTGFNQDYVLTGDTLIGGEKFVKCYTGDCDNPSSLRYMGSMQEDGKKVFAVSKGNTEKELVFDFSLNAGDTFMIGEGSGPWDRLVDEDGSYVMEVADITPVDGNGSARLRRFRLVQKAIRVGDKYEELPEGVGEEVFWVEGMGVEGNYPFQSLPLVSPFIYSLKGCYEDGVLLFPAVSSQPLFEDGKVWVCGSSRSIEVFHDTDRYYIDGTATVDGRECFLLFHRWQQTGRQELVAAVYEEGEQAYAYVRGEGAPVLLYDFSLRDGEKSRAFYCSSLFIGNGIGEYPSAEEDTTLTVSCESREREQVNGRTLTTMQMMCMDKDGIPVGTCWWKEGVGSEYGIMLPCNPDMPGRTVFLEKCYTADGTVLYETNWGTDGISTTSLPTHSSTATYDLQGRHVTDVTKPGVYVRNGKKVVIK